MAVATTMLGSTLRCRVSRQFSAVAVSLRPAAAQHRFASSSAKPCDSYLQPTHLDGAATDSSEVSQKLAHFDSATLATYSRPSVLLTRGKGLDLWATCDPASNDGAIERQYLDFSSGIAVNSLGHADPQLAEIAADQAKRLVHSSNLYHNEWSGELAVRMVDLTAEHGGLGVEKGSKGGESGLKVFFSNSGTESNEAALKFARKVALVESGGDPSEPSRKSGLVSFKNAFHGRTMGALSMTPNPKYQAPFAPLIGNVKVGEYNSTAGLNELIDESTAGVIVEPVQGEGGIFPAELSWLQALRKRCDEVGAVLIFDEIQCGLFRSGTMWAHSEFPGDAHPDIVTMAKPLANGFPIGAVLMRKRIADAIVVGDHGTTFGGGPFVSRLAHHVLGRLSSPELLASAAAASEHLIARLTRLRELFPDLVAHDDAQPHTRSPRGRGLLLGVSMKDPAHAARMLKIARERGLIILSAGKDTLRFAPSLIVSKEQIDKAGDILESCMLVLREEEASKIQS